MYTDNHAHIRVHMCIHAYFSNVWACILVDGNVSTKLRANLEDMKKINNSTAALMNP